VFRTGIVIGLLISMVSAHAELNDPTRPVNYVQDASGKNGNAKSRMQVSSIIIGKERRVAIIDGQSVQKGDDIHGMTVLAIRPSEVLLKSNNKELQVSLLPEKVKEPVIRKELQK